MATSACPAYTTFTSVSMSIPIAMALRSAMRSVLIPPTTGSTMLKLKENKIGLGEYVPRHAARGVFGLDLVVREKARGDVPA